MVKHIAFLRWLLIAAVTFVGAYFCNKFGLFAEIYEKDWSYISVSIAAVFVVTTTWCGIKTFVLSSDINKSEILGIPVNVKKTENLEEIGWFIAEQFTVWGFIGTVVGIVYALNGFVGVDTANPAAVQKLIANLVYGMSTALYTTLAGLVCSFFLKLQYINLGHARRKALTDE